MLLMISGSVLDVTQFSFDPDLWPGRPSQKGATHRVLASSRFRLVVDRVYLFQDAGDILQRSPRRHGV